MLLYYSAHSIVLQNFKKNVARFKFFTIARRSIIVLIFTSLQLQFFGHYFPRAILSLIETYFLLRECDLGH